MKTVSGISGKESQHSTIFAMLTTICFFMLCLLLKGKIEFFGVIFSGVESVSVDMKDQKMTVTGDVDSVKVAIKLKKFCHADILSVGPAKEEKKPDPPKAPENKDQKEDYAKALKMYEDYFHQLRQQPYPHYYYKTVEENPNGCVIC